MRMRELFVSSSATDERSKILRWYVWREERLCRGEGSQSTISRTCYLDEYEMVMVPTLVVTATFVHPA